MKIGIIYLLQRRLNIYFVSRFNNKRIMSTVATNMESPLLKDSNISI